MTIETQEIFTAEEDAIAQRFGDLTVTMLTGTDLSPAWQLNFLANFFVGPIYRELDRRFGLSRPDFVILFSLSQQPGLVARDVCLATGLPKNSISRAVSELLSRGLIRRDTSSADRRAKPLALTSAGRDMLAQVLPLFGARQSDMRSALTPTERADFDRLLMKLIRAMPGWVGSD